MKKTKKRRTGRKLLCGLMILGILTEGALLALVYGLKGQNADRPAPADVLVVLGALIEPDGKPADQLRARLDTAVWAYEQALAPAIIVCGGQGRDEPETEARAMARELIAAGVDESAIRLEERSHNTLQNLQNARELMARQGEQTALIVTSDYHMTRALWLAGELKMDARGLSAPTPGGWGGFFAHVRETLSWIKYFLTQYGRL